MKAFKSLIKCIQNISPEIKIKLNKPAPKSDLGDLKRALEVKILTLADDPEKAHEMGAAGQEKIKCHFSIKAMCDTFYNAYKKLIP